MLTRADEASGLRLAIFAALAAFATAHWAALVAHPPLVRVAGCLLVAGAGAAALELCGRVASGRLARFALAAVVAVATGACAAVVIGLPVRLLAPGNWDGLEHVLRSGLAGVEDVEYPYRGDHPWSRLVILLALPLWLGVAAAVAFWPARKRAPLLGGLGLLLLVGLYATAVIMDTASHPILRGSVLFLLLAGGLWLPRLELRRAPAFVVLIGIAALLAVPIASALNADRSWFDYGDWRIDVSGRGGDEVFGWDHSYGPLDWPRTGKQLLEVRSESPHYWRATTLDSFDGFRWRSASDPRSAAIASRLGSGFAVTLARQQRWTEWIKFSFDSLRSRTLITAGAVQAFKGIEPTAGGDGLVPRNGVLEEGDHYSLLTYAPDPSPRQMRRAPPADSTRLSEFTTVEMPLAGDEVLHRVTIPPWGTPVAADLTAQDLEGSPYARVYALARRWTEGRQTAYGAAEAVREHLRRGYEYSEDPPARHYPLRAFLFADRIGYCQQFSGAMALMLRMLGIPSRVAAGFSPGQRDGNSFRVSDYDAHSWVEVYFSGIGWVPFDPTPAASPAEGLFRDAPFASQFTTPPDRAQSKGGVEPAGGVTATERDASNGPGPWIPLGVAGLLLAGMAAPVVVRRRRWRSLPAGELEEVQLREFERALRRFGWPVRGGTTLRQIERHLARRRGKREVAAYAAGLRSARYGTVAESSAGSADRRRLRRALGSGGGVRARLRALLAVPLGGPSLRAR